MGGKSKKDHHLLKNRGTHTVFWLYSIQSQSYCFGLSSTVNIIPISPGITAQQQMPGFLVPQIHIFSKRMGSPGSNE